MAFAHVEQDEEAGARVNGSIIKVLGITVEKLRTLGLPKGSPEGKFIEGMDLRLSVFKEMPSTAEVQRIKDLAWKYRRQMPVHLAPKLPPNDPIIQEMEQGK